MVRKSRPFWTSIHKWIALTDPDCGTLKMSLNFGPGVGLGFETTKLEIVTGGL
jgi:hypothetical protein